MVTKEERAEKIKEILRTRARQIFVVLMVVLLVLRVYLYWVESQFTSPPTAKPSELTNLTSVIRKDTLDAVQAIIKPLPELTTSTYSILARIDMFDAKAVNASDSVIARSNQMVGQAQAALDQGTVADAQRLLEDALSVNPGSVAGRALKKKIQDKVAAANNATSATQPK